MRKLWDKSTSIFATGEPTHFGNSVTSCLELDKNKGEVVGLPREVGVFDLNVSAFNIAGARLVSN